MSAEILPFPQPVTPIAHYIHLGDSEYHKLADLHSSGRLPARRVVVDASKMVRQRDLIDALRRDTAEIVVDTKAAELSVIGKCGGRAKDAPWAQLNDGRPLTPDIFSAGHRTDIFGAIARFAVEQRVHAVLAPSHYLADPNVRDWFAIDQESCRLLRKALDREGGQRIEIDFLGIAPCSQLNQDDFRKVSARSTSGFAIREPMDSRWQFRERRDGGRCRQIHHGAGPVCTILGSRSSPTILAAWLALRRLHSGRCLVSRMASVTGQKVRRERLVQATGRREDASVRPPRANTDPRARPIANGVRATIARVR